MTLPSDAAAVPPVLETPGVPSTPGTTRPFYWSVRRELWENRGIYLAPLAVAGVVLFGFLIGASRTDPRLQAMGAMAHMGRVVLPYHIAAVAILIATFLVAVFYCLGALHGERRDRSILFWKSLPVSDLTAVASKASIPLIVLPAVTFTIVVTVQIAMFVASTAVLLVRGENPAVLWTELPLIRMWVVLLYGLVALALWWAPVWGWLLLVSAWARRMTFLWAVGPPLALSLFETMAFGTNRLGALLAHRLGGGFSEAFRDPGHGPGTSLIPEPDPAGFLASPGVWIGLAVAAAFLAAAIRLRRSRGPI